MESCREWDQNEVRAFLGESRLVNRGSPATRRQRVDGRLGSRSTWTRRVTDRQANPEEACQAQQVSRAFPADSGERPVSNLMAEAIGRNEECYAQDLAFWGPVECSRTRWHPRHRGIRCGHPDELHVRPEHSRKRRLHAVVPYSTWLAHRPLVGPSLQRARLGVASGEAGWGSELLVAAGPRIPSGASCVEDSHPHRHRMWN
jgi:hypothetical protein